MKINFIYFSCLRDFKSLYYSVNSVLKLFPKSKVIIFTKEVFNIKSFHKNVEIRPYEFENNRNLNGEIFVINLLKVMSEESANCDFIGKIDSDVLMFNKRFLKNCKKDYSLIGKECIIKNVKKGVLPYSSGGFYLVNSKVFKKIKNLDIEKRLSLLDNQKHNDGRWAEDERVTSFIKSVDSNILLEKQGLDSPMLGFWPYNLHGEKVDHITISMCKRDFDAVEFGRISQFGEAEKFSIRDNVIKTCFN